MPGRFQPRRSGEPQCRSIESLGRSAIGCCLESVASIVDMIGVAVQTPAACRNDLKVKDLNVVDAIPRIEVYVLP